MTSQKVSHESDTTTALRQVLLLGSAIVDVCVRGDYLRYLVENS